MIRILTKGFFEEVAEPLYGRQDIGISPGGAMDRFSFRCGKILLQPLDGVVALEMIWSPTIQFVERCCFVLTGARHTEVYLRGRDMPEREIHVQHGRVYRAPPGSVLQFGTRETGFRSYLSYAPASASEDQVAGRFRGAFNQVCRWFAADDAVRVVPGPEHGLLADAFDFTQDPWTISRYSNKMGMRLERSGNIPALSASSMVSAPVSDGTVQMTPTGPIVLLRHRQTIGGYPRIFNVISADVDRLAQFAPDQLIRFREVTMDRAMEVAGLKAEDLERFARRFT